MKYLPIATALLLLSGCAATITQLGPDTFRASDLTTDFALQAAARHCADHGLNVLVDNMQEGIGGGQDSYVIYKCLSANDPEYKRPRFETVPDVVIKNQK